MYSRDPGIHQKRVRDTGFDCSWEAGFTQIGHGMRDSDKKESGMRGIFIKRSGNVGSEPPPPPFQTLNKHFRHKCICKKFIIKLSNVSLTWHKSPDNIRQNKHFRHKCVYKKFIMKRSNVSSIRHKSPEWYFYKFSFSISQRFLKNDSFK